MNTQFDNKSEFIDHIRAINAACGIEEKILTATGVWLNDKEKARFQD